jgi:hypothetical protein
MKITPVDSTNRLFLVEDFVPADLVSKISQTPWHEIPWRRADAQEHWARRELIVIGLESFELFHQHTVDILHQIESLVGAKFSIGPYTSWWYDEPGFTVKPHVDQMPSSLQLYWHADSIDYGTVFYNDEPKFESVRYKFPFTTNTGYIMLDGVDGHPATQYHAMQIPVKTFRISSYTRFGRYVSG